MQILGFPKDLASLELSNGDMEDMDNAQTILKDLYVRMSESKRRLQLKKKAFQQALQ